MSEKVYSVPEIAELLNCSIHKLYRRIQRGDLKATISMDSGRRSWVVTQPDLDAFLAAGGVEHISPPAVMTVMLTVSQVAARTKLSTEMVRALCRQGILNSTRTGWQGRGHFRITPESVDRLLWRMDQQS